MIKLLTFGGLYFCLFLVFVFASNLTLMNMLIGILCDVITCVSSDNNEERFRKEVDSQVERLAAYIDSDKSGTISKDEFDLVISDPHLATSLHELGVDIVGVAHFAGFIFDQIEEITYQDFALLVSQFRGTKMATVKDVMDMRRYMTMELLSLE